MLDFLNASVFSHSSLSASWAELIGALLSVAMVLCNIRQIHWGWPLAFLSSVLYAFVFAGAKLFGESALQVFFAASALWGWAQWLGNGSDIGALLKPQYLSATLAIKTIAVSVLLTCTIGVFLSQYTSSDVPWWDALPTALSLTATWLLAKKYIENWPLWIVVNLLSMALFAYKGLWLTVGLYGVFALMAAMGWRAWVKAQRA